MGDATVVAAMDADDRTPSSQMTSADRRLKSFTERITKAKQPPLLELPEDDTTNYGRALFTLPKRSKQIAAQSLSHIPASKRGEHLVLKCLGLTSGMASLSTSAMKAYEEIYSGDPDNIQAHRELLPSDDDVGARKRCRRRSAARA